MTSQMVNLQVTASIPIDCDFWSNDDGWKGLCKSLSVTVEGSSFEDARKKMATGLQAHIEKSCVSILREPRGESPERGRHDISERGHVRTYRLGVGSVS